MKILFGACIVIAIMPIFGLAMVASQGNFILGIVGTILLLMIPQVWLYVAPASALLYGYLLRALRMH